MYLRGILAHAPGLDTTARQYLEEALVCFRHACYRASAVMLGGASETLIIRAIEAFRDALQNQQRRDRFVTNAIDPLGIAARARAFRQELQTISRTIPQPLRDNIDLRLDGIFALIRMARNDAGHPSAVTPAREDAYANLLLFPSYCETVYDLIAHLHVHPIT